MSEGEGRASAELSILDIVQKPFDSLERVNIIYIYIYICIHMYIYNINNLYMTIHISMYCIYVYIYIIYTIYIYTMYIMHAYILYIIYIYYIYILVEIFHRNNHVLSSKLGRKLQNLIAWSNRGHHSHAMCIKIKLPFH